MGPSLRVVRCEASGLGTFKEKTKTFLVIFSNKLTASLKYNANFSPKIVFSAIRQIQEFLPYLDPSQILVEFVVMRCKMLSDICIFSIRLNLGCSNVRESPSCWSSNSQTRNKSYSTNESGPNRIEFGARSVFISRFPIVLVSK